MWAILPLLRKPGLRKFVCHNIIGDRRANNKLNEGDLEELRRRHQNAGITVEDIYLLWSRVDVQTIANFIADCTSLQTFSYSASRDSRGSIPQFEVKGMLQALSIHCEVLERLNLCSGRAFEDFDQYVMHQDGLLAVLSQVKFLKSDCLVAAREPPDTLPQRLPESLEGLMVSIRPNRIVPFPLTWRNWLLAAAVAFHS